MFCSLKEVCGEAMGRTEGFLVASMFICLPLEVGLSAYDASFYSQRKFATSEMGQVIGKCTVMLRSRIEKSNLFADMWNFN